MKIFKVIPNMSIIPEGTIAYVAWKNLTIWINGILNVTVCKRSFQRGEIDGDFLKHRFIGRSRMVLFGKELIIQKIQWLHSPIGPL